MDLTGIDTAQIDGTLIFSHPAVDKSRGPLYIRSGANAIKWAYHLNTVTTPTIGGEVIQILSAMTGPMQIQGQTAGLSTNQTIITNPGWRGPDNYTPNDELKAIMDWFVEYMTWAGETTHGNQRRDERAILFKYPARQWVFHIMVTGLDGFRYDKAVISPEWAITAEVVSDNALNFFSGITMSSFTDDLLTNLDLLGTIGLSHFADSATENQNGAFGQTGDFNTKDPFLNPTYSPSAADQAKGMGDNFQALVAAWSGGGFSDFAFAAQLDSGASPKSVNDVYSKIFGTSFLGQASGSGAGAVGGTVVYGGANNPTSKDNIVLDIASTFEAKGIPGKLGVAVSMVETGGSLNPDDRQPNGDFAMGLFQTFPGGAGGTYHKSQLTDAINNKGNPVTKYYPTGLQIQDASMWFAATSGSQNLKNASDQELATFGQKAQGAGDPSYISKVLAQLGPAQTLISNASLTSGTTGSSNLSAYRASAISWAQKFVVYSKQANLPQYAQLGRKDQVESITPGDFAAANPDDCSSWMGLIYAWATNNNHAYGLNGNSFNGVSTGTIWNTWGSKAVIQPEQAKAGDLIVWGSSPGEHVDMLMEDFKGDSTLVIGHGTPPPIGVGTYGGSKSYFVSGGHNPYFFRILP